mmetsp:Transcript_73494/g.129716  ORF Transcript_73494/g.129716 Transcript_73494/m.129716 type:complete len:239 (-) Transcript_73494:33-749(-)
MVHDGSWRTRHVRQGKQDGAECQYWNQSCSYNLPGEDVHVIQREFLLLSPQNVLRVDLVNERFAEPICSSSTAADKCVEPVSRPDSLVDRDVVMKLLQRLRKIDDLRHRRMLCHLIATPLLPAGISHKPQALLALFLIVEHAEDNPAPAVFQQGPAPRHIDSYTSHRHISPVIEDELTDELPEVCLMLWQLALQDSSSCAGKQCCGTNKKESWTSAGKYHQSKRLEDSGREGNSQSAN